MTVSATCTDFGTERSSALFAKAADSKDIFRPRSTLLRGGEAPWHRLIVLDAAATLRTK